MTSAIFRKGCDHSDNVILYRWVIFTEGGTYSCNVTFVLLSHIWARICVSTETLRLIVVALKPQNVNLVVWVQRKSASGNNECLYALFANPSDVLIFLCLSGADKSHQDSSLGHRGYQCLDSWQSPEWPLKKYLLSKQNVRLRVAPDEKAANHQMWMESLRIITSDHGPQNVIVSTHLKGLKIYNVKAWFKMIYEQSPIYSCSYVHMLYRSILYSCPFWVLKFDEAAFDYASWIKLTMDEPIQMWSVVQMFHLWWQDSHT